MERLGVVESRLGEIAEELGDGTTNDARVAELAKEAAQLAEEIRSLADDGSRRPLTDG